MFASLSPRSSPRIARVMRSTLVSCSTTAATWGPNESAMSNTGPRGPRIPAASQETDRTVTVAGNESTSAVTSDVLPEPASPPRRTTCPAPAEAHANRRDSSSRKPARSRSWMFVIRIGPVVTRTRGGSSLDRNRAVRYRDLDVRSAGRGIRTPTGCPVAF